MTVSKAANATHAFDALTTLCLPFIALPVLSVFLLFQKESGQQRMGLSELLDDAQLVGAGAFADAAFRAGGHLLAAGQAGV
jgi:hypothetical protein